MLWLSPTARRLVAIGDRINSLAGVFAGLIASNHKANMSAFDTLSAALADLKASADANAAEDKIARAKIVDSLAALATAQSDLAAAQAKLAEMAAASNDAALSALADQVGAVKNTLDASRADLATVAPAPAPAPAPAADPAPAPDAAPAAPAAAAPAAPQA